MQSMGNTSLMEVALKALLSFFKRTPKRNTQSPKTLIKLPSTNKAQTNRPKQNGT